jgi:hypothetical protein
VRKQQWRFEGLYGEILALSGGDYRLANSRRRERRLGGLGVGRDLSSRVDDAVMEGARA